MKQRALVTFKQEETIILKQSGSHVLAFCPRCDREIVFVTPEILAALTDSTEREIFRLLEAGAIHFIEKQRTYACSECYRTAIEQKKLVAESSAVKSREIE